MGRNLVVGAHLVEIFTSSKGWPKRSDIRKLAKRHGYDLTAFECAMQDYANDSFHRSPHRSADCPMPPHQCGLAYQRDRERSARRLAAAECVTPTADRLDRRAFARVAGFRLSALMMEQDCMCPCCGCDLIECGDYHLDHIQPLALGGVNEYWNAQFLCARCNLGKSATEPYEWARKTGAKLPDKFKAVLKSP